MISLLQTFLVCSPATFLCTSSVHQGPDPIVGYLYDLWNEQLTQVLTNHVARTSPDPAKVWLDPAPLEVSAETDSSLGIYGSYSRPSVFQE